MRLPVLDPTKRWECPSCHATHVTRDPRPHTPMHGCPAQHGLSVPYVEAGTRARHVAVERGDWIGSERGVAYDDEGRAVMAVRTERPDGSNDVHVFAPRATGEVER